MTERIIDWPDDVRISAQEWELLQPRVSSRSAFSGAVRNRLIGPPRWTFAIDTTSRRAEDLARLESTVRKLRGGLNLVRMRDMRRTGTATVLPGNGLRGVQMLRWSGVWSRWGRVGPLPVSGPGGEVTMHHATDYYQADVEPLTGGIYYALALDVSADAPAQVAIAVSGASVDGPLGAIFDAHTGAYISQYGAVSAHGAVDVGGHWRCWLTFRAERSGDAVIQAYALLPVHGMHSITMRRPQLAMQVAPGAPSYVAATDSTIWTDMPVVVDGAGQGGDMLNTMGWPPGVRLTAGHWISYGDGMHMLLDDAVPDADGKAALWIEPPIRRSPAHGQAVTIRGVTGLFRLTSSPRIRQEQGIVVPGQTLTFEEELQ